MQVCLGFRDALTLTGLPPGSAISVSERVLNRAQGAAFRYPVWPLAEFIANTSFSQPSKFDKLISLPH
jgi:hypothetical protein